MADKAVVTQTTLDAIGQAIIDKGGATEPMTPAQMPAAIQSIPSGEGPKPWYGHGTHIWMHFEESYTSHEFYFTIKMLVSGSATIDWGDGNTESVSASASVQTIQKSHIYADGDYTAHITGYDECEILYLTRGGMSFIHQLHDAFVQIESDTTKLSGNGNSNYSPIPTCRNLRHINLTECTAISNAAIGNQSNLLTFLTPKVSTIANPWVDARYFYVHSLDMPVLLSVSGRPFNGLPVCESIKIGSAGITSLPDEAMRNCARLRELALPQTLTDLGSSFLYMSLMFGGVVKIPEGVATFTGEALRDSSAKEIDLPTTMTSIGNSVWTLYGLHCLERLIVRATTPPTLPSTNNLSALASFCKIYVPYGCGETYKTATNWSAQAGKIYELNQDGTIPQA